MRRQCTCTLFCTSDVFGKNYNCFPLTYFHFYLSSGISLLGAVPFWPFGLQGGSDVRARAVMVRNIPGRYWQPGTRPTCRWYVEFCFVFCSLERVCYVSEGKQNCSVYFLYSFCSAHMPHLLCLRLLSLAALIKHLDVLSSLTLES